MGGDYRGSSWQGLVLGAGRLVSILILLTGLVSISPAAAEIGNFRLAIDQAQASGLPWRGASGMMFCPHFAMGACMNSQNSAAPSASLCIVRLSGQRVCDFGQRNMGPCPLSYECEYEDVRLPDDDVFGIVVVSQGIMFRALVDAVVIYRTRRPRTDPQLLEMDQVLRETAAQLAPPNATEAARRSRRFSARGITECGGSDGCRLTQSRLSLTFGEP